MRRPLRCLNRVTLFVKWVALFTTGWVAPFVKWVALFHLQLLAGLTVNVLLRAWFERTVLPTVRTLVVLMVSVCLLTVSTGTDYLLRATHRSLVLCSLVTGSPWHLVPPFLLSV